MEAWKRAARRANKTRKVKFKSKVKILITRLLKPKRLRSSYLLGEKKCSHIKRIFRLLLGHSCFSGKRPGCVSNCLRDETRRSGFVSDCNLGLNSQIYGGAKSRSDFASAADII